MKPFLFFKNRSDKSKALVKTFIKMKIISLIAVLNILKIFVAVEKKI